MIEQYFMTNNNYKLIMSVLYEYFIKKKYEIGEQEERLCYTVMEYYLKNTNQSKKESLKIYLQRLNKLVLGKMINVIENNIKEQEQEKEQETKINVDKKDMGKIYEQIMEERKQKPSKIEEEQINKKIKDNFIEDNSGINDQYTQLNLNRQNEQNVLESQLKNEEYSELKGMETSGQEVLIEQPEKFKELVETSFHQENEHIKHDTIVIDSRDRDTNAYTSNSNYQIDLDEEYKNILSVELLSIDVPKSQYLINNSNNKLYFTVNGGSELIATIPIGNYSISELLTALKLSMDTVSGENFTITSSALTNKITIQNGTQFSLIFSTVVIEDLVPLYTAKDNNIGGILGFPITSNITVLANTDSIAPNQYNLNGPTYLILHINEFENLFGKKSSIKKGFAKIPLDATQSEYKYFKNTQDYHAIKEFTPPLSKLGQLNISFLNYEGGEYDFGGLEHSIVLKIRRLNQSLGYFTN